MARNPRVATEWKCLPWWRKAAICCAHPTVFYISVFAGIGLASVLAAPLLDSDLRVIGLILIATSAGMLLLYLILAYRAFGRSRPPECSSGRRG